MNLKEIEAIYSSVKPFITLTPLIRSKALEEKVHSEFPLYLKAEHQQKTGSFKVRGSAYCLSQLSDEEKKRGVIARSSGNFSAAVAYLTKEMGIKSTLILATTTPDFKKEKSQRYLSEVIIYGDNHIQSMQKVLELKERYNYTLLHPYDHVNVIKGQGTLAYEIFQKNPEITTLILPLGGGGLASGCAQTFKTLQKEAQIFTVEPIGANDYFLSRKQNQQVTLQETQTLADGLRAPTVGKNNWPLLNQYVDETFEVSDQEIIEAMKWLYKHHQMIIEPSGAVSVALLLKQKPLIKGPTALILSGGNIEESYFFTLLDV